ncbi:glycosyl hydrolases family 31-domain-containing protein [Chytridium lagenaria]|nr:glycosyl hydrolases family 31-domain-containing protein [Chytridium lagenaria]
MTPMVDEENINRRFCGPTSFTDGGNTLETASVRVTIDSTSLAATVFDKVKNVVLTTYSYSGLSSGEVNSFSNPTNLVLQWTREQTEDIYGVAAAPTYGTAPLTSEGNWMNKSISVPNPFQGGAEGFGNTMVGVQEGAMIYAQLPIVYNLGSNGYQHAFFVDDQHRLDWDLTTANHRMTSRGARALRWYAIAGSSLNDLRKTYLKITGPMAIPPKSVFGLQISKFGYKNWAETNFEVDSIIGRGFPLDAVIYDLYWFGGTGGGFGKLAWDPVNFPDPTGNLRAIRAKGPGAVLIEEPYIDMRSATYEYLKANNGLAKLPNGQVANLNQKWWGSGSYVDHTSVGGLGWSTCKRCKLISGCRVPASCPASLESTGSSDYILGHWQDLGEPEIFEPTAVFAGIREDDGFTMTTHRSVSNIYQLLKTKATFELYKNNTLFRRPVSLTRTVAPGIQRYGAATWSGDIPSFAPAVASSFGVKKDYIMAGIEIHSSDIGGFHRKGCKVGCDINRLYTVWFANSVWFDLPVRPHVNADEQYARSFTASPAAMGDVASNLFNIRMRYFLLPLYYSLAHRANREGETLITPLFLQYPNDKNLRNFGNQYMIGPIMVAYTVDTNTAGRGVYLPSNTEWYNFHTNERVLGTGTYSADISYNPLGNTVFTLPALVQAGSIFPTAYVDDKTKNVHFQDRRDNSYVNPLQIRVYPGAKSTFTATDDDGETLQSTNVGAYSTTDLTQELVGNTATVTIAASKGYFPGQQTRQQIIVEVVIPAAFKGVASVSIDGKAYSFNELATTLNGLEGYKLFDVSNRIVGVYGPIGSVYTSKTIVVTFN